MLEIIKKSFITDSNSLLKKNAKQKDVKTSKHFPSSVREWDNSIYLYNKNTLKLIPNATRSSIKIIKGYFYLFNKALEQKTRTKRLRAKIKRLSSNKIYLSKGEFKHTNNKLLITLYTFNRQKNNYLLAIKNWYLNAFFFKKKILLRKKVNFRKIIVNRLNSINVKGLQSLKNANKNKHLLLKVLNSVKNNKDKSNYKSISKYIDNFYKKLIKKSLKKLQFYLYYRQLIYINKSKFNYTYLKYMKKSLEAIYNKNVEFNIVNLKRFYLNSDILSESITLKLTKNRRKMHRHLKRLLNKIAIQKKKTFTHVAKLLYKNLNVRKDLCNKHLLQRYIINDLKYKNVTGFRLEAKGRLSRRYTASRSVRKLRYNGNLLNFESSYKGLSSVILKGNLKSNIQYTKLNSKTRIGTFGIKGWVSGN